MRVCCFEVSALTRQGVKSPVLPPKPHRLILTNCGECLYRSASGIYYAIVKKDGQQRRKNLGTDDRNLARQKLAEFRNLIYRPPPPAKETAASIGGGTVDELAVHWLEFIRTPTHIHRLLKAA